MSTKNETQSEATTPANTITRDSIRAEIARLATALGCDKVKSVSTEQYRIITAQLLYKFADLPAASRAKAEAVQEIMDANASAMRQRLYERKQKSAITPAIEASASKYANLD